MARATSPRMNGAARLSAFTTFALSAVQRDVRPPKPARPKSRRSRGA
jgi:hypothetical protein